MQNYTAYSDLSNFHLTGEDLFSGLSPSNFTFLKNRSISLCLCASVLKNFKGQLPNLGSIAEPWLWL